LQPAFPVQAIRPARICEAFTASPMASMAATASGTFFVAHAWYQEVLPDRETEFTVAELVGDFGQSPHLLRRHLADGKNDADPVKAFLLLPVHAEYAPCGRTPAAA